MKKSKKSSKREPQQLEIAATKAARPRKARRTPLVESLTATQLGLIMLAPYEHPAPWSFAHQASLIDLETRKLIEREPSVGATYRATEAGTQQLRLLLARHV